VLCSASARLWLCSQSSSASSIMPCWHME
jgi:hypothetical protein